MSWAETTCGGNLCDGSPVFNHDGSALFCPRSNTVDVYSVLTGDRLATLSGHTDRVTALFLNPFNNLQLYTTSLDGSVRVWDTTDRKELKVISFRRAIVDARADPTTDGVLYAVTRRLRTRSHSFASASEAEGDETSAAASSATATSDNLASVQKSRRGYRVMCLTLETGKTALLFKSTQCTAFDLSSDGQLAAVAVGSRLFVWHNKLKRLQKLENTTALKTLAFQPGTDTAVTGDASGRLVFWYSLLSTTNEVKTKVWKGKQTPSSSSNSASSSASPALLSTTQVSSNHHWHSHAVLSMCFSDDGAYLLSGGSEGVLVIWQTSTSQKQFLPRLGGAIHGVAVSKNSELYALYTASNDVLLVNALSMKLERRIQGVQYSAKDNVWLPKNGLVVDPLQGTLVMNGQPGTLQFYDAQRGAHVRSLTVQIDYAARNRNIPSADTRVDHIVFVPNDHTLVTVDRRQLFGSRASEESHLRFWHRDLVSKQCMLDTEVTAPHKQTIHVVVAHPFEPWVVTCSADHKFKLWERRKRTVELGVVSKQSQTASQYTWYCRSVGFYRNVCGARAAAFSPDGSILAVSFGAVITLWDPYTDSLEHTLTYPPANDTILKLAFTGASQPYLVACTASHVYVWDLLTRSVWWSYEARVSSLAADAETGHFAIALAPIQKIRGEGEAVVLFNASAPTPLQVWRANVGVRAVAFLPVSGQSQSSLVYMNSRQEFVTLTPIIEGTEPDSSSLQSADTTTPQLLLKKKSAPTAELISVGTSSNAPDASPDYSVDGDDRDNRFAGASLLNGPSHTLSSMDALFPAFMKQLMIYTPTSTVASSTDADASSSSTPMAAAGSSPTTSQSMDTASDDEDQDQHESTPTQTEGYVYAPRSVAVPTNVLISECSRGCAVLGDLFEGAEKTSDPAGGNRSAQKQQRRETQRKSSSASVTATDANTPRKLGKRRAR
mmetsp:Transcript_4790/g.14629  ORF Transcript_4790/g.14629 Transcript_4790/m.14629 type:complete len:949 (+) Transcript_4790:182-3028(+)|eukprot:CAMPEP_0177662928 /NCGR_PEP_ID=MMETSP0447-20121125/19620_1 /TAXON_ID=0 /ORGANISM="Stygamoeba regulata, Strain BSH-02190019" /LENGTH=948 /DNA_ID=CAMNT_0019168663 /DNA_START=37 /DNA_END=2883 /DNA_ORIENTATION=-